MTLPASAFVASQSAHMANGTVMRTMRRHSLGKVFQFVLSVHYEVEML